MSITTERLRSRTVGDDVVSIGETAIADLPLGRAATVTRLCVGAGATTARRFFDVGFTPGAEGYRPSRRLQALIRTGELC